VVQHPGACADAWNWQREDMFRRRWVKRTLAASLSLAVALTLAELGARVAFGVPYAERLPLMEVRGHPTRGWEMLPASEHYTYQHRVRVNNLGLRGEDLAAKRPHERRVLLLGDSMIYGQGVAEDQTVPFHLQARLKGLDAGVEWTAVNGGLRGYSTAQELALLEQLYPQIQPDVVVLCWFDNDLSEPDVAERQRQLLASGPVPFDTGERLEGARLASWRRQQCLRRSALIMWLHDAWRDYRHVDPGPEFRDRGLARARSLLVQFAEMGGALGFRPLVAIVPNHSALGRADHPSLALAAAIGDACRELELECVELLGPVQELRARTGRDPVIPYDGHYLGDANRAMAEFLAPRVLALRPR
jgi:lysophospholipase L1-like esterase